MVIRKIGSRLRKTTFRLQDQTREKQVKLRKEFRAQAVTAIIAAFGFLIALTWRDAIQDAVNKLITILGVSDQLYFYKFLAAIIVTIIAIFGIMFVSRFKAQEDQKDEPPQTKK